MTTYGVILENRPTLRVNCNEDLVDLWTKYMSKARRRVVWRPVPGIALNSLAIIGVRKMPKQVKKRVGGFTPEKRVNGFTNN